MTNVVQATQDGITKDFDTLQLAKTEFPDSPTYLVITDQSPEAQSAIAEAAVREREWRDAQLVSTDTVVDVSDYNNKENMVAYRKELRNWPTTANFPSSTRPVLKTD